MTLLRKLFKALAWTAAGLFAILLLLSLYAPWIFEDLLHGMGIDTGSQPPILWVAFTVGLVIVLAGLFGTWGSASKGSRRSGHSGTQKSDEPHP